MALLAPTAYLSDRSAYGATLELGTCGLQCLRCEGLDHDLVGTKHSLNVFDASNAAQSHPTRNSRSKFLHLSSK
jgi:hypothetical protein